MEKISGPGHDRPGHDRPGHDRPGHDNVREGKTDLSRYDNSWYKPGSRWKIVVWYLVNAVILKSYLPIPVGIKKTVMQLFGAKIGHGVMIKPGVNVKYPWLLTIGNYVWVGEGVWIDNLDQVTIGDHVCLSQGAMLLTGNHDYRKSAFDLIIKPIHLEDGAWIGAQAVVCPGVRCHTHSVLAVGSVATHSLEAYGIYQGNPANFVRKRQISA